MPSTIPENSHAMIIGAMKCATSSLYYNLIHHPQICPASVKEPEFFSENQTHGISVDKYEDLFEFNPEKHSLTLEASTGYTKYPQEKNVARNIYEYGLRPKFIYSVRNPFDRIVSQYHFSRKQPKSDGISIDSSFAIDLSNYYLQLEQYRKYFSLDDILIVDFDDIRKSPRKVFNHIYQFLDLELDYLPEEFEVRNKTPIRNKYVKAVREKFKGIKKIVPQRIKDLARNSIEQLFPTQKRKLSRSERDMIFRSLEKDMRRFNEVYNFDVSKWGF